MSIAQMILPEFEQEMAGTRKTLERVPNDKLTWKAHPKSNTIQWVASHLVDIPGWVEGMLSADSWDFSPPGGEPYQTPMLGSSEEMVREFDKHVASAIKAILGTSDEAFGQTWTLLYQGEVVIAMPRLAVTRTFILNHSIHHRAYLCSYLRLNDIPVPALYGPSGDE
jgi:uncharacterized damage-inducible protein DinB